MSGDKQVFTFEPSWNQHRNDGLRWPYTSDKHILHD